MYLIRCTRIIKILKKPAFIRSFALILQFVSGEQLSNSVRGVLHCQLTASSWLPDSPPCQARLFPQWNRRDGMTGAWRPEKDEKTEFLEIDLGMKSLYHIMH